MALNAAMKDILLYSILTGNFALCLSIQKLQGIPGLSCMMALYPNKFASLPCIAGGILSTKKRKKHNKGVDPIKGGFMKAPKRGDKEPLTEMEQKAEDLSRKIANKQRKAERGQNFVPKRNVRKKR